VDDNRTIVTSDRHTAATLEWCLDYDFLNVSTFYKHPVAGDKDKEMLEELALLCILESADRLEGSSTELCHLIKFRDLLQRKASRTESATYLGLKNSVRSVKLPQALRRHMIEAQFERLSPRPSILLVSTGILRICEFAEDLFTGRLLELSDGTGGMTELLLGDLVISGGWLVN